MHDGRIVDGSGQGVPGLDDPGQGIAAHEMTSLEVPVGTDASPATSEDRVEGTLVGVEEAMPCEELESVFADVLRAPQAGVDDQDTRIEVWGIRVHTQFFPGKTRRSGCPRHDGISYGSEHTPVEVRFPKFVEWRSNGDIGVDVEHALDVVG